MAIRSKTATATFYRDTWLDDQGKPESGWIFRKYKTGEDDDAIQRAVVETNASVDPEERRRARKAGIRYTPQVSIEVKATTAKATIARMSVDWFGSEFELPADFEDEPGHLSEYAGQVPPCTLEWINLHDSDLLSEVEEFLDDLYAGRSEDEQAAFRGGPTGLAKSEADGSGEAEAKPRRSAARRTA